MGKVPKKMKSKRDNMSCEDCVYHCTATVDVFYCGFYKRYFEVKRIEETCTHFEEEEE